jgi:uncharacterized protein (DUF488 family)
LSHSPGIFNAFIDSKLVKPLSSRLNSPMSITIYTIGHGRHSFDYFLGLLSENAIEYVIDVRTFARSRWPHFNGLVLRELLKENRIGYEHLPECGGRMRPLPEELNWGLGRIIEIASELKTVLMCSESQPLTHHRTPRANCHRIGLLAPRLRQMGVGRIIHILPDGRRAEFDESKVESIW